MIAAARRFFDQRGVMEVDTPVLGAATTSEVNIASLHTQVSAASSASFYLQTSPESAMKRLLAAGSGPIYQFARAFRDGEAGPMHNPEFLLLEWYRPEFQLQALMDEVVALVTALLELALPVERFSYRDAFEKFADIDPFSASLEAIDTRCRRSGFHGVLSDRSAGLDFLLTRLVQPALSPGCVFLFDFPAEQAAQARILPGDPPTAERFELFLDGIEIANGYRELADAREQQRRTEADLARRKERGLPAVATDFKLIEALEHGLPECTGVALGFDRLVARKSGVRDIRRAMSFPIDRA